MKILLALTEGKLQETLPEKIFISMARHCDDAGNENFPGVTWEWRSGTVDQDYIAGFGSRE